MLNYCKKYQVPVVMDSDAHFDTLIGEFDMARELLTKLDFPEELVLNRSAEKAEKISEEVKFTDFTNTNVYATINYSHKQKHRDEESTCTTVITENSRRLRGK